MHLFMKLVKLFRRRFLIKVVLLCCGIVIPINLMLHFNMDPYVLPNSTFPWQVHSNGGKQQRLLTNVPQSQFLKMKDEQSAYITPVSHNLTRHATDTDEWSHNRNSLANIHLTTKLSTGASRSLQIPSVTILKRPSFHTETDLWPTADKEHNDRILEQLDYKQNLEVSQKGNRTKLKQILALSMNVGGNEHGQKIFLRDSCQVNKCYIHTMGNVSMDYDAVIFKYVPSIAKHPKSVWIWYQLESPYHANSGALSHNLINWTATYRSDSTLVTPYEKFVPFANITKIPALPNYNFGQNKTKMVAWFVSNCKDKSGRLRYAKELSKYIQVDIYGACGNMSCSRKNADHCFEMLTTSYKFYLSFENSACRYYITEKFFWNGLFNDIVPIVLGASPEDYARIAPPNSYIHVDDFESPKHLAEYLHILNKDDDLYNQYFRWKGTGEFINTKFWCRVCAMLHAQESSEYPQWYPNVISWFDKSPDGKHSACLKKPNNNWASWRHAPYNYTSKMFHDTIL